MPEFIMRTPKKRTHLYLCGTFRTASSRAYNLRLEERFISAGISCYLPQKHSDQSGDRKRTFLEDVQGIDGSECVIAVGMELQSANWGFEIGYCYGKGIPVIAISDEAHPFDLMTSGGIAHSIVRINADDIDEYWDELLELVNRYLDQSI